jgi:hypothetical protein
MGRERRRTLPCYPDRLISGPFSRRIRAKPCHMAHSKKLKRGSAGALHCDRPQAYRNIKFERLIVGRTDSAMSKPFGTMPADANLAAFGSAFGGWLLGTVAPNLMTGLLGGRVTGGHSHLPWWLSAALTAFALALTIQVRTWPLRAALLAFAAAQALSIGAVARALVVGPTGMAVMHGVFASTLLFAAWPHTGRLARALAIGLFVVAVGFKMALRSWGWG